MHVHLCDHQKGNTQLALAVSDADLYECFGLYRLTYCFSGWAMALGKLSMETIILIALLTGAGLVVLRHLKKLMIDGEPANKCHNCLSQTKRNSSKR